MIIITRIYKTASQQMGHRLKLSLMFLFVVINTSCAQQVKNQDLLTGIPDTTYKNVIEISDKEVVTDGTNFLFDSSIPSEIKSPVVFVSAKLPLNFLPQIYPEFQRLTIITPNWKYYDEIAKQSNIGEPIASSIIYQLNRENDHLIKDSLVIMGGFPKMEMVVKASTGEKALKIYLTEYYGSVCCPRDPQWDIKPNINAFITDFEKKQRVKIKDTYVEHIGKEGEIVYYFSFSGLSKDLILKFIAERTSQLAGFQQKKTPVSYPAIFTPIELIINDRMKVR